MLGSETPAHVAPFVEDGAPTVDLVVHGGTAPDEPIPCRRVINLIGSRPGCKVTLRHPLISPLHVALVNTGTQVIALDLVTNRGTKLNGLKMEHETLRDGDLLTVHPWQFQVHVRPAQQAPDADVHPFELDHTPHVVALEHLATGRILQPNREVCIIGRRRGCDILIDDERVSRAHALIFNYFGYPALFDLLSRNGTRVNGGTATFQRLKDGDVLQVGDAEFRVCLVESSVARRAKNGKHTPDALTAAPDSKANRSMEKATGHTPSTSADKPATNEAPDKPARQAPEKSADKPANEVPIKPASHTTEKSAGQTPDKSAGKPTGHTTEKSADKPTVSLAPDEYEPDLVDIESIEGGQRWAVADSLEKVSRKR